jgi:taurine dioxygenase
VVENGKPIGNLGDGEAMWHADMTYVDVPPKAGLLHALEVPPPEAGGNTYFANLFEAENLVNKLAVLPHDVVSKARQIYE